MERFLSQSVVPSLLGEYSVLNSGKFSSPLAGETLHIAVKLLFHPFPGKSELNLES